MYADDTTVYCIGDIADNTVTSLDKALSEMNSWCLENSLTPHSAKCEAMLLMRKLHIEPLSVYRRGSDRGGEKHASWALLSTTDSPGHISSQM